MKIDLHLELGTQLAEIPAQENIKKWLSEALQAADLKQLNVSLSVRIVNKRESAILNSTYRRKMGPTNVLSFPYEPLDDDDAHHLGELILCAPIIAEEAIAQDKTRNDHWAHIVIHGALHLCGYDHIKEEEAVRMEQLETDVLGQLGIAPPY